MKFSVGIASVAGGIILREIMDCFGIRLVSMKGIIICIVVGLVYGYILNKFTG